MFALVSRTVRIYQQVVLAVSYILLRNPLLSEEPSWHFACINCGLAVTSPVAERKYYASKISFDDRDHDRVAKQFAVASFCPR
jgi:hypothetical protein